METKVAAFTAVDTADKDGVVPHSVSGAWVGVEGCEVWGGQVFLRG